MDAFTIIVVGGMAALIIALLLIGQFYPGSGAEVLDWKPTRSLETEAELEIDDLAQMLEAQNERRRRRGLPDRTIEEVEQQVAADLREQTQRLHDAEAEREGAEEDLAQLLALSNERRRRRGEPPLSIEEFRAQLEAEQEVARMLIVGGGCRGRELARGLVADGHAVRITTRGEGRRRRSRPPAPNAGSETPTSSARCATPWTA